MAMKLFFLDLITGALLIIALLITALGIAVLRYRRGIGPSLLIASGSLIALSSILDILTTADVVPPMDVIRYLAMGAGLLCGLASLALWRR